MENTTLNLSHIVPDIINAKKHSFDPELIVPLKQKLFRQAIDNDDSIVPCNGDHFSIRENELVFWYNSQKDKSTKITKIKIGS